VNHRFISCWLFGLLFFIPIHRLESQGTAQISSKSRPWWVNLGAGAGLIGTQVALDAGMVYCYQFEPTIISARVIGLTNKNPTVQRIDYSSTQYKMTDYGILYGPMWQSACSYLSLGAGIGLVRAAYETPDRITTNSSVSMPIEAQWFLRPTNFAGIGVYAYASLNFEKHLAGILVCAQLGVW